MQKKITTSKSLHVPQSRSKLTVLTSMNTVLPLRYFRPFSTVAPLKILALKPIDRLYNTAYKKKETEI
jgi:hypothetical protein